MTLSKAFPTKIKHDENNKPKVYKSQSSTKKQSMHSCTGCKLLSGQAVDNPRRQMAAEGGADSALLTPPFTFKHQPGRRDELK